MKTRRKKRLGFEIGVPAKKSDEMKTYRNEEAGFEIDVPEEWSLPTGGTLDDIRCLPDEAIHFAIGPLLPERLPDYTEREFTQYARDKGYTNLQFGRIFVGGKEHVWARYHEGHGEWTKKYMLAFGGIGYVITTTGASPTTFAQREKVWDAMVASFRLSESREQNILKLKAHRSEIASQLYERAYEAVAEGRYSEARVLLERCLSDNPDHTLAHKELAVVLKKMGDLRGALPHRREVKRLDPSDTVNRFNLADLLAVLGARDDALREVEELLSMEPYHPAFQALKMALMDNSLTYPQHYDEESQQQPGKKRNLKLIESIIPDSKSPACIILVYQWGETLSDEVAKRLGLRAVAYIACAIYDAATTAGLNCQAFEIPHGRRPSWLIDGEKMPISVTLSDIDISDRTCQMTIGAMAMAIGAPPSGGTHWEKLLTEFQVRFSNISV
jgi:tetratricopeptide (TPR) repeat protein